MSDDGPGIEADVLERIFDPFFTTKRLTGGTGLGLSVSLGIAESHGGTLTATSEPGHGASFTLCLPIANGSGGRRMSRILVIDDEDVIRSLVIEILEAVGHTVTGAESAERALKLLDATEFDLVVSDVVMPGLSGLELLELVRARQASLPVVLVTGAGTYDTLSQALTRGAAGLVTKPFAHTDLQSAVAHALERASRSRDELRERLLAPTLASALANAIEARDSYLHGHCERLAALAVRIAELLGLTPEEVETVRLGAILHDIGKIGIPDRVLLKPGRARRRTSAASSRRTRRSATSCSSRSTCSPARARSCATITSAGTASGYPDGSGRVGDIPLGARIVAVADSIEVMSSRQLYQSPRTPDGDQGRAHARSAARSGTREIVELALQLIETGRACARVTTDLHLVDGDSTCSGPLRGPRRAPRRGRRRPRTSRQRGPRGARSRAQ